MTDLSQIRPGMTVIGADGVHIGTVDHVHGHQIKLAKADSPQTKEGEGARQHSLPAGLIAEIDGDTIRLSATAQNVQDLFEQAE